jgi:uncharacterized protein with GYD domain
VPKSREANGGVCAYGGPALFFLFFQSDHEPLFRPRRKGGLASISKKPEQQEIAMHFCLTGQYTPRAINSLLENPNQNRAEIAKKLIESAGGKLVSFYSVPAEGPGVLTIFDVPDPTAAPAIVGIVVAAGTLHNVKLSRLYTQDEVIQVRQKASKLRAAYSPPGG